MFFKAMTFFSFNALKYVSINNQEDKKRSDISSINNNEPLFYSCCILVNKCSGICNNINHSCAELCVREVVEDKNIGI